MHDMPALFFKKTTTNLHKVIKMKTETINGLDCLVFHQESPKALVLFHGFGADKFDLAPLSQNLGAFDYYFPNGSLFSGSGGPVRGWFSIEPLLFEQALMTGNFDLMDTPKSREELVGSQEAARGLLERLGERYETVCLGGFSQGAALAVSLGLSRDSRVEKLIALSGFLIKNQENHYNGELETFQSHGLTDMTLPYSEGMKLKHFLTSLNPDHEFHSFGGGHEIPHAILDKLKEFLAKPSKKETST